MPLGYEAVLALQSTERDLPQAIVSYLFDFSKPKYLFDDLYHFSGKHYALHATSRNMLPVVKFMLTEIIQRAMGQPSPLMLVPEAITNGKLYYDLAQRHEKRIRAARDGLLTTYRMGAILNKGELGTLSEKNKNLAMARLEGFQKLFPDIMAISPTGMEAMLKTLMSEPGFSNYQMLRDEDFEAFWIGVCLASDMGGFADEVAYSRNGNFETFALFQARYGLIPFRPKGDVDIVFPDRSLVRPVDYVHMLVEHLEDVVPRGFTSDLSLKMAMRMMMLEDMRVNGLEHPEWGKLNFQNMNPALRDLPASHNREFADMKQRLLSLMDRYKLQKDMGDLFGLDGYDGLYEYSDQMLKERGQAFISAAMPDSGSGPGSGISGKLDMNQALVAESLEDDIIVQTPYQHDGEFFSAESKLFNEGHFGRCEKVAQITIQAAVGLYETPKRPLERTLKNNGEIFVLFDRRGGKAGQEYAEWQKLILPGDARGIKGSFDEANFEQAVKARNIDKVHQTVAALKHWMPKTAITTSEDIENTADNFCRNRQAFAADGSDRLDGMAKLALAEELLLRHGKVAVFDKNWENSAYTTMLRLHARKIQLGLIERPVNMPPHGMIVADIVPVARGQKPYEAASLVDDIRAMSVLFEKMVRADAEEYPRHLVKGLIEAITFADLYYNDGLNHAAAGKGGHGLIDWQSVPSALKNGLESSREEFLTLKSNTKALILAHGLHALTPSDVGGAFAQIDPEYERAKFLQDAQQNEGKSRRKGRGSFQVLEGFNAARPR